MNNYPEKKTAQDYELAREWLVDYCKGCSVYEYGSVDVYGISDIDCIVVTGKPLDMPVVPEEFKVMFEGRIFAQMKPEHFRQVKLPGDIDLKRLSGESVEYEDYDEGKKRLIDVLQVMDWLPERIVKLEYIIKTGNILDIIGFTKSLKYSIDIATGMMGNSWGVMWGFVFEELRKGWFDNPDEKRLVRLADEGVEIGKKFMYSFADYAEKWYEPFDGDIEFGLYDTWITMPKVWQTHIVEQAHCGGIVGDEIRRRLRGKGSKGGVDGKVAALIAERVQLCNSMAEFTREGLYRWGHILSV